MTTPDAVLVAIVARDPRSSARLILELRALVERAQPLVEWALDTQHQQWAEAWIADARKLMEELS